MSLNKFEDNGVTYFELYIRCPVCIGQGKTDLPIVYWRHADNNCSGDIYVGDNAFYKCRKCGSLDHVRTWKYRCPRHSNPSDNEFLGAEGWALTEAVTTAGQMVRDTGQAWLRRFLDNMGDW